MPVTTPKSKGIKASFSTYTTSGNKIAKVQSLPKGFFSELIKLETEFHNRKFTMDTIDQLVQHYAKAVEHYDSLQDDISSYFGFKIQDTLATRRSLALLDEKQKLLEAKKELDKLSASPRKKNVKRKGNAPAINPVAFKDVVGDGSPSGDSSPEEKEKVKRQIWQTNQNNRKESTAQKSIDAMKTEKQKFVLFYNRVQNEMLSHDKDATQVTNKYVSSKTELDKVVKTGIETQKDRLRQKLEEKKNRSFASFTMNNSMNNYSNNNILNASDRAERKDSNESGIDSIILNGIDDMQDIEGDKDGFAAELANEIAQAQRQPSQKQLFGKQRHPQKLKSLFARQDNSFEAKASTFSALNNEGEEKPNYCLSAREKKTIAFPNILVNNLAVDDNGLSVGNKNSSIEKI